MRQHRTQGPMMKPLTLDPTNMNTFRLWKRRRAVPMIKGILGAFCIQVCFVSGQPSTPEILWQHQITGLGKLSGAGIRRGNGVVAASTGTSIWVTSDDGSVYVLKIDPEDPSKIVTEHKFVPKRISGRSTECRSSISLYESPSGGVTYGVYAVIDIPENNDETISSRVIALHSTATKKWESIIDGIAVGTPEIGLNGDNVFITHNTKSEISGSFTKGKISLFRNDLYGMGDEIPLQNAGGFGFVDKEAPFAPVSVFSNEEKDLVYWTESWENGRAQYGLTYTFDSDSFKVKALSRTTFSSIVAPTLSSDGKFMWLGGASSSVYGWTNGKGFNAKRSWKQVLSSTIGSAAISKKAIVSPDNTLLYINSDIWTYCLDALSGELIWKGESGSVVFPEPRLSLGGEFVYSIDQTNAVKKYYAKNGRVLSNFSCGTEGESTVCQSSVEAEFSVSADGSHLYYSDISGHVVALEFGEDVIEPTVSPSEPPSAEITPMPTSEPSTLPTQLPTDIVSALPTSNPTIAHSSLPSSIPSSTHSLVPSDTPSLSASFYPTESHSLVPTSSQSSFPTQTQSGFPTVSSSFSPTNKHSQKPVVTQPISPSQSAISSVKPSLMTDSFELNSLVDSFKVDFHELMQPEKGENIGETKNNSSVSTFQYALLVMVVFVVSLIALLLGVLHGRLLEIRRIKSLQLPWSQGGDDGDDDNKNNNRTYRTYDGRQLEDVTSILNQHKMILSRHKALLEENKEKFRIQLTE